MNQKAIGKRIKAAREQRKLTQRLFIDDFAVSRYFEDGIKILYHLIKTRTDMGTSTMFACQ